MTINLGQVTLHHIISPALLPRGFGASSTMPKHDVFKELFGEDEMSDDSMISPTSSSSSSESEVDFPTEQVLLWHLRTGV